MRTTLTKSKIMVFSLMAVAIMSLLIVLFINFLESNKLQSDVENIIRAEMLNTAAGGNYTIDGIQQSKNHIYAVVYTNPVMGQGNVCLYMFEKKAGILTLINKEVSEQPISLGVAVYKAEAPDVTIIYGAVSDQTWINPDEVPKKVEFSEAKILYSQTKEQSTNIKNFQSFMFVFEGYNYIDDVIFLSGNEVVSRLSEITNIERFNELVR